jgi:hypothetical protein
MNFIFKIPGLTASPMREAKPSHEHSSNKKVDEMNAFYGNAESIDDRKSYSALSIQERRDLWKFRDQQSKLTNDKTPPRLNRSGKSSHKPSPARFDIHLHTILL